MRGKGRRAGCVLLSLACFACSSSCSSSFRLLVTFCVVLVRLASALRVRHGVVTREYNRFNKLYLAAARSGDGGTDDSKRYGGFPSFVAADVTTLLYPIPCVAVADHYGTASGVCLMVVHSYRSCAACVPQGRVVHEQEGRACKWTSIQVLGTASHVRTECEGVPRPRCPHEAFS